MRPVARAEAAPVLRMNLGFSIESWKRLLDQAQGPRASCCRCAQGGAARDISIGGLSKCRLPANDTEHGTDRAAAEDKGNIDPNSWLGLNRITSVAVAVRAQCPPTI